MIKNNVNVLYLHFNDFFNDNAILQLSQFLNATGFQTPNLDFKVLTKWQQQLTQSDLVVIKALLSPTLTQLPDD